MKRIPKFFSILLTLCLTFNLCVTAFAATFTDAHGNVIELDDSLEAYSEVTLSGGEDAARRGETNLGDLCADAYRYVSGADVAFVNGGGIRVSIKAGDITRNDILKVHPFGNMLCVCEATGQQILDALELSVKALPGEYGGFLQVSGLTFEVHTYLPSTVKMDEKNMFVGVEGERRVRNVMVAGEPIDPEATYTVASHNYMLMNGGDGNTIFKNNHFTHVDVMLDNQVLLTYVTEALNGVIGEAYANPYGEGRIVAVEAAP